MVFHVYGSGAVVTSSARPDALARYAGATGEMDDDLARATRRVAAALDTYRAGRPEFGGPVPDLDHHLRRLAADSRGLDEWVGGVGAGFGRADGGPDGHLPAVAGCTLLTPTRLRRRQPDGSDQPLDEPLYAAAPVACGSRTDSRRRPARIDIDGERRTTAVFAMATGHLALAGEVLLASRKGGSKGKGDGAGPENPQRPPLLPYHRPPEVPKMPEGLRRVPEKSSVTGGGKLRRRWVDTKGRIYEWDFRHGRLEKYNRAGRHVGEFHPETGEQTGPAKPERHLRD